MTCPRCGAATPEGARFCPSCGETLSPGDQREERKTVSILFVDQVGSTARADGADPEDVRDRNRLYYDEVRTRIERHGGLVEKYIGDAVMAVFGAPLARADDAERAVRAGLSVLEGIRALNERDPDLTLEVRVGICTGPAVVQIDPPPGAPLATGDIVNVAARLQSAAPIGRVAVGDETHRLTKNSFVFEQLEPIIAKGKKDPIDAWAVDAALTEPAARPSSETPLMGRDSELQLIRTLWDRAANAQRPHVISIVGPAGIGKSRLAKEISASLERVGAHVLWGRSLPYDEQTPYHAAGQMVRHAAGIFENDPPAEARTKLTTLIDMLLDPDEAPDIARYLSLMLGLGVDNPASHGQHLQFAMRRLAERLSQDHPLLLVFDDMHWADEALIELVDYLANHLREHRIVVMVLARPEVFDGRAGWGGGLQASTSIVLEPLTMDEASEVVSSLLADARKETVAKLVSTAEGNPLFIEELVASHAETDADETLPATVRAVIAGRIDALPAEPRMTLLHASVVGRTFWRGILNGMGVPGDIDAALEALEIRGFVRRHPASNVRGDVEFAFKHDLVRDVSYETLPRAKRVELHAATARALEGRVADASEVAWLLAFHWREGGDAPRALRYLLEAADRARDALAVADMNDLYARALDLATTDAERNNIKLRRGVALVWLHEDETAREVLADVIPRLAGDDQVEGLVAHARASLWTEHADETIAFSARALELAQTRGPEDLVAPAMAMLSFGHASRGAPGDIDRAMELGIEALEIWLPGTRSNELAEAYHMQGDNFYWVGDYENAARVSRLSRETAGMRPTSSEFRLRGVGLEGLALAGLGRYEEAIKVGNDAIAIAIEIGAVPLVVKNYSTMPLRDIFAFDEARRRSLEVIDALGGPATFNMPWVNARADYVQTIVMMGDIETAETDWPIVWDEAQDSRAWEHWLITGRLAAVRAQLEMDLGHTDDAVTWAERAVELAEVGRRRKYATIAKTILGVGLTARGDTDAAVSHLRGAIEIADALSSPLLRWQTRAAMATALDQAPTLGDREAVQSEAFEIIRGVVASLTPEHAAGYRAARPVAEFLDHAGVRLESPAT